MSSTHSKTKGACGGKPVITQELIKRKKRRHKPQSRRAMMLADLKRSGLTPKDAKQMACKPASGAKARRLLGFAAKVKLPDGYLIPYFDIDGNPIDDAFRWKALDNYRIKNAKTGKYEAGPKYLQPVGTKPMIYHSPLIDWAEVVGPIRITEGEKKAATACKARIPTIGLGGVWSWRVTKSDDVLLPELEDGLYKDQEVEICFDSDLQQNSNVRLALIRLGKALEASGRSVKVVYLPDGPNEEKVGLDDFIVEKGTNSTGKLSFKRARKEFQKLERHDVPEIDPIGVACSADITPEPLLPVWPDVMYRRKVMLFAGNPGLGKSLTCIDITSRVSTGAGWPGGGNTILEPSNVAVLSGEDDHADTIVPRLEAAGAVLTRVHLLSDVVEKADGHLCAISLDTHIKSIHKIMLRLGARLLVIDPVSAFMGEKDAHNNSSIRALINKLRQYAVEGDYAVLLVTHFNKPGDKASSALHRVMGSLGFVAAARSVFAFVRDPADPDYRLMLPIKNNLGGDQQGFRCRIELNMALRVPAPRLVWDDDAISGECIDEVMANTSPRAQAKKSKEEAIGKWLDRYLKHGKHVSSDKFNTAVKDQGFTDKAVRKLMTEHGYEKKRKGFGIDGKWYVERSNL